MSSLYHKKSSRFTVHGSRFLGQGQSLIEVLVAMAIVALLAISLVTTTLLTQRSARTARNNTQATNLVQQSIEQMRVFRDRKGYNALQNNFPNRCWVIDMGLGADDPSSWVLKDDLPPAVPSCPQTIVLDNTSFNRSILIEGDPNPNKKKITVSVVWQDSSGPQSVSSVTYLSNCVFSSSSGC